MDALLESIAARKQRLDQLRPISRDALLALQKVLETSI